MAIELNFESLLSQLGENARTVTKGNYIFQELTMQEQRKILNMSMNPIEISASISNIFNEYIRKAVTFKDDLFVGNMLDNVTLDIKPYMIIQLRQVTLGDTYIDNDGKKYTIREVTDDDLTSTIEPTMIEFNDFILRLSVPTLSKDNLYNQQLITELNSFKKKLSDDDYGKIADLYQTYELLKYITEIEFKGDIFDFEKCPTNKKIKIINNLPQRVVNEIGDYIDKVKEKEEVALTAFAEDGSSIEIDMNSLFFTKTAREKK